MSRPHVVKHGTVNEYGNFKCRCDLCREAWSIYMKKMHSVPCRSRCGRLASKYSKTGLCRKCEAKARRDAYPIAHGTESGYNRGCKCRPCMDAAAAARRRRRREKRLGT